MSFSMPGSYILRESTSGYVGSIRNIGEVYGKKPSAEGQPTSASSYETSSSYEEEEKEEKEEGEEEENYASTSSSNSIGFRGNTFSGSHRQFPPPIGHPLFAQPQRVRGRGSTPKSFSTGPFQPPKLNYPATNLTQIAARPNAPSFHASRSLCENGTLSSSVAPSKPRRKARTRQLSSVSGAAELLNATRLDENQSDEELESNDDYALDHPSADDPMEQRWQELEHKRQEVFSIRAEMYQTRLQLKRSRDEKDSADNAFMAVIRPLILNVRLEPLAMPTAALEQHFKVMQSARNEYQVLETSYFTTEERLSDAEHQLDLLERKLINELRLPILSPVSQVEDPWEILDDGFVPSSRTSLLGIPADRSEDVHPLYTECMSVIGYFELAKEEHEMLLVRKALIEAEQETLRLRAQHELDSQTQVRRRKIRNDDLEFLRDFKVEEKAALDEMKKLGDRVEELKKLCREQGAVPKHAPFDESYWFEPDIGDDRSIDFEQYDDFEPAQSLTSIRFPVLLSSPQHLIGETPMTAKTAVKTAYKMDDDDPKKAALWDSAVKEFSIEILVHDSNANDKSDFINRWLLQILRTSPLQAELLFSSFSSTLKILNIERWQQDVIYFWSRDDAANISQDVFLGLITSAGTSGQ